MRIRILLVLGLAILLLDCGTVLGQGGFGGRGGGRGGGGPGGGGFDPTQLFDQMSGGKDVVNRADIADPRMQRMFDRFAERLGVSNGQITRDQFVAGMQQMRNGGGRGPAGPGGPGGPAGPGGVQGPGGDPRQGGNGFDLLAEREFKQLDKNGDNFLNTDEVTGSLRTEFSRWDTNRDGLIDLTEFKAYYRDQMRQAQNGPLPYDFGNVVPEEEDRRPVVYTAGNYPKELPAWFKQLDLDKDGQIGLYEWRRAGKSIDEFEAMDRNSDGFLTVEEVLYAQALAKKGSLPGGVEVADLNPGNGRGGRGQFAFGNGQPQFGNGPPQFGGKQRGGGGPGGDNSGQQGFGRRGGGGRGGQGNDNGGQQGFGRRGGGGGPSAGNDNGNGFRNKKNRGGGGPGNG